MREIQQSMQAQRLGGLQSAMYHAMPHHSPSVVLDAQGLEKVRKQRMDAANGQRQRQQAASLIQSTYHAHMKRRMWYALCELLAVQKAGADAAAVIQSMWRVSATARAAQILQSRFRALRERRQSTAAVAVQSGFRGAQGRRNARLARQQREAEEVAGQQRLQRESELRVQQRQALEEQFQSEEREEMRVATLRLQGVEKKERKEALAAITLQSGYRGHHGRQIALQRRKVRVGRVEQPSQCQSAVATRSTTAGGSRREAAATVLQSCYRGRSARQVTAARKRQREREEEGRRDREIALTTGVEMASSSAATVLLQPNVQVYQERSSMTTHPLQSAPTPGSLAPPTPVAALDTAPIPKAIIPSTAVTLIPIIVGPDNACQMAVECIPPPTSPRAASGPRRRSASAMHRDMLSASSSAAPVAQRSTARPGSAGYNINKEPNNPRNAAQRPPSRPSSAGFVQRNVAPAARSPVHNSGLPASAGSALQTSRRHKQERTIIPSGADHESRQSRLLLTGAAMQVLRQDVLQEGCWLPRLLQEVSVSGVFQSKGTSHQWRRLLQHTHLQV